MDEIPLHPKDKTGVEILDKLEAAYGVKPITVTDDGVYGYQLSADVWSQVEENLGKIDPSWRDHINKPESQLDEELDQEQLDEAWEEAGED